MAVVCLLSARSQQMQQSRTIRLIVLERFCDEVLGWHPRMLYGDAYDLAALSTNGSRPKAAHDREAHR